MKCPVDRHELTVRMRDSHVGHACDSCGGVWLPAVFIESIAFERHFPLPVFYTQLSTRAMPSRALACPTGCGALSCAAVHDVAVDWCMECRGAWFDPDELRRVLQHHPLRDPTTSAAGSEYARYPAGEAGFDALWLLFLSWLG